MTEQEKNIFGEWEIILRNISDYVQIARINGIKFEIYTNEQGKHNKAFCMCPHQARQCQSQLRMQKF